MSVSEKVLRKMKRVMGVIGASVVSSICASQVSFADFYDCHDTENGNDIVYSFNVDSGMLTVSGKGELTDYWKENIGYLCTKMRYNAFLNEYVTEKDYKDYYNNKSQALRDKVRYHAYNGYVCYERSVERVVVTDGSNITGIGDGAFSRCGCLKKIVIPETVRSIGKGAFRKTGLTEVSIPGNVKEVGDNAFNECRSLRRVLIKYGVQTIGSRAFNHCISLESLTIPTSVEHFGYSILGNCYYGKYAINGSYIMPDIKKTNIIVDDCKSSWIVEEINLNNKESGNDPHQVPMEFYMNGEKFGGCKFSSDEALCREMYIGSQWNKDKVLKLVTWLCAMKECWIIDKTKEICKVLGKDEKYKIGAILDVSNKSNKIIFADGDIQKVWSMFNKK